VSVSRTLVTVVPSASLISTGSIGLTLRKGIQQSEEAKVPPAKDYDTEKSRHRNPSHRRGFATIVHGTAPAWSALTVAPVLRIGTFCRLAAECAAAAVVTAVRPGGCVRQHRRQGHR
jgi:hypothetical protein